MDMDATNMTSHSEHGNNSTHHNNFDDIHANNPAKRKEHIGLLSLLPHEEATHVAVNDGSWFDSSTWKDGKIPNTGAKVLIPKDRKVFYDDISDESIKVIRVDGDLEFAHNKNTKLVVDTLFTDVGSTLKIGSETNPIQADKTTQILIDGSTVIDKSWDPTQISRGVVTHGKVEIYGADKDDFLTLALDAEAGDSQLVLKSAPKGWRIGDQLVLGGTNYDKKGSNVDNSKFQDEVLTITSIEGNIVKFINNDIKSGPNNVLRFDHARPDGFEDKLNLYVANTTRNVVFETLDADQVPVQQRGHTMFMHNPDVVVQNAGFYSLGRTDKNKLVDDIGTNRDGRPGNGTNIRGRYPLHFHKTGADDINSKPSLAKGNAIVDGPGWGITHHDSHAILEDNVVFDVVGSGISSESGNELGAWRNNITIKTTGADAKDSLRRYGPNKPRLDNFDMGVLGEGFWVQGAGQIAMEDNIAISAAGGGVNFFGSGDGGVKVRDVDNISTKNLPDSIKPVALGKDEVDVNQVPLRKVSGFESYNSDHGIFVWGRVRDDFGDNPHNVFSLIEDFKIWGLRDDAVRITYSSQNEFKNGIILGDPDNPTGRAFVQNELANEIYYTDLHIEGFEQGIKIASEGLDRANRGAPDLNNKEKHSKIEGVTFANNIENLYREKNGTPRPFTDNLEIIDSTFETPADNTAPTAQYIYNGNDDLTVDFDASGSFDADAPDSSIFSNHEIVSYGWDFDSDGTVDEFGRTTEHTFSQKGLHQVTLRVWDSDGATGTIMKEIVVGGDSTPINPVPEPPAEEPPAEEPPVEEPPAEEPPVEEPPVEEPPVEEPSGEEASPFEDSLFFSLDSNQNNLDGLNVSRNDIVKFDGSDFSLLFDGSDVSAGSNINAFDVISDTEILISFKSSFVLGGVGEVSNADILKFTSTSLGSNTSGFFEIYLDGSDVGLSGDAGDIDGLTQASNGDLLLSLNGKKSLSGVGTVRDEDILRFSAETTGDNTSGTWSMYLDGSTIGLKDFSENLDALSLSDSGDLLLSTRGDFNVTAVAGADEDIFVYAPSSSSTGTYSSELLFKGSQFGLSSNDISAIDVSTNSNVV